MSSSNLKSQYNEREDAQQFSGDKGSGDRSFGKQQRGGRKQQGRDEGGAEALDVDTAPIIKPSEIAAGKHDEFKSFPLPHGHASPPSREDA